MKIPKNIFPMKNDTSYPEEMFQGRLKRYRAAPRTKLPHQVEQETCRRIHRGILPAGACPADVAAPQGKVVATEQAGLPLDLYGTGFCRDAVTEAALIRGRVCTVVLDDTCCVVDAARQAADALQKESCGECTVCRIGTRRMFEMLDRICSGTGIAGDIDELELLAGQIFTASLCELGKTAAGLVLTSLRSFRNEYEEHVLYRRCRAGVCRHLNQTAQGG